MSKRVLKSVYLIYECPLRLYFSRNFKESSKSLKTIDLILTSNFEVFWGWFIKDPKFMIQFSASKILEIFEMSIINLKKPQSLRVRLRILLNWGLYLPPYCNCAVSWKWITFEEHNERLFKPRAQCATIRFSTKSKASNKTYPGLISMLQGFQICIAWVLSK